MFILASLAALNDLKILLRINAYPTFILARCSRLLGFSKVVFASGVAGGLQARPISSTVGPYIERLIQRWMERWIDNWID